MDFTKEQQEFINKLINEKHAEYKAKLEAIKEQYEGLVTKLDEQKNNKESETQKLQEQLDLITSQFETLKKEKEELEVKNTFNEAVQLVENEVKDKIHPAIKKLIQAKGLKDKNEIVEALKAEYEEDKNYFEQRIKDKNLVQFEQDEETQDLDFRSGTHQSTNSKSIDELLKSDDLLLALTMAMD